MAQIKQLSISAPLEKGFLSKRSPGSISTRGAVQTQGRGEWVWIGGTPGRLNQQNGARSSGHMTRASDQNGDLRRSQTQNPQPQDSQPEGRKNGGGWGGFRTISYIAYHFKEMLLASCPVQQNWHVSLAFTDL